MLVQKTLKRKTRLSGNFLQPQLDFCYRNKYKGDQVGSRVLSAQGLN